MPSSIPISRLLAVAVLSAILTACGYAEWPPPGEQPADIHRPAVAAPATFTNATAVIVGKGDSVYALSRRHRVTMRVIIEANGLKPPYILQVGQRIKLPRGPAHQVVKGDTLSGIALRYDVSAGEIARLNGLKPPYLIRIGETLALPSDTVASNPRVVAVSPNASGGAASARASRKQAEPKPKAAAKKTPPAWASRQPGATATKSPPSPAKARVPEPPPTTGSGFLWPVRGRVISSFGTKGKGLRNDGINIAAQRGTPVRAAENGVVAYAGNELRGFGNLLLIKHSGGWVTAYAHNDRLMVKRGDRIRKGQEIATVGSSGNVKAPQLHFEIRKGRRARDPRKYLRST